MGKKRGGLAGIWDRNKKVIKPVVSGLAGLVGTPALGAAVGAAMGGLDREGKGGIGFDVGQGIKGGIAGYGAGTIGQGIGSLAGKAGMNIGQGALGKLNTGGGKLANAFLGSNPATGAAVDAAANTAGNVSVNVPDATPVGTGFPGEAIAKTSAKPAVYGAFDPLTASEWGADVANASVGGSGGGGLSLAGIGGSVAKHPEAWAQGLGAAAKFATAGSENRQNEAASRLTAAQAAQAEYDMERKKKSDIALESIRQQLAQQLAGIGGQTPTAATLYGGYTANRNG